MTAPWFSLWRTPRDASSADWKTRCAAHTVQEIIVLLGPYSNPSRATKRRRDDLIAFATRLPLLAQVILTAVASNTRGTKRTAREAAPGAQAQKRMRVAVQAPEESRDAQYEGVHVGGVDELIEGPFMRVPDAKVIEGCIARCIDRTSNQALKKGREALPYFICAHCSSRLSLSRTPATVAANNLWVGDVPFVLAILTLPERLLVALYFPAAYVVKLFPKKAGGKKWDKEKINSGLRGNISTYRLNTNDIADMLTGNLMPRPVSILASIITVAFVGARTCRCYSCRTSSVRRQRVADALLWLKQNNPLYANVEVSPERLSQLPVGGIPEEIMLNARYSEEESILDKEHAGYVPVDLGDLEEDDEDDLPEVADGEQREMVVEEDELAEVDEGEERTTQREDYERHALRAMDEDQNEASGDYGGGFPPTSAWRNRLKNLLSSGIAAPGRQADFGIRPGNAFVNEYAREENGRRTDGGAAEPNHLLGAFPVLFPYGMGGLEVDRMEDVGYQAHVRWCLQYDDSRFRKDLYFVFQVFGVIQKRMAARSASLQIKRTTYIANEAAFLRLSVADFVLASKEEATKQPISNPVIRSLRKQLTACGE
ncbi:ATP-dependent DNA helicase [Mycena chlorophos]|uniref:ATP-dependent DNA helicase n=1 Tax=Mycena chlorophos TaxID=658473 RepID=A0A8H6TLC3_MYCCL|nr:ATP-dependent DNA helicase [Mycena chlorophos]